MSTPYIGLVKVRIYRESDLLAAKQSNQRRASAETDRNDQAEYDYAATNEEELDISEEQLLYVLEDDDAECVNR